MAALLTVLGTTAIGEGFEDTFADLDQDRWHVAHYDFSHPGFDTDWRESQVEANDGLRLKLSPHNGMNQYAGSSIRTKTTTQYGRYEARLQAGRGDGVVTGFFTYTGPHYGSRHDEIDVEILGRDTTKLHVAWFVDGKLTNHFIPLGFDAADAPHDYAFEWLGDRLIWYVDGVQVFEHHARDGAIPSVPSYLFANIWMADPSIASWSGVGVAGTETEALVSQIRFTPIATEVPNS